MAATSNQTPATRKATFGRRAKRTPRKVARPFPPRNLRKTGYKWPRNAARATPATRASDAPTIRPRATGAHPFSMSRARVRAAAPLQAARRTFVAPMFPLPIPLTSTPFDALAIRRPNGMEPDKYPRGTSHRLTSIDLSGGPASSVEIDDFPKLQEVVDAGDDAKQHRPPQAQESKRGDGADTPSGRPVKNQQDHRRDLGQHLVLSDIARMADDAQGGGDRPQPGDRNLTAHNEDHHPGRGAAHLHQRDEGSGDEQLVSDRVEQLPKRGDLPSAASDLAVQPIGQDRGKEDGGSGVIGHLLPGDQKDDNEGDQEDPYEGQFVRQVQGGSRAFGISRHLRRFTPTASAELHRGSPQLMSKDFRPDPASLAASSLGPSHRGRMGSLPRDRAVLMPPSQDRRSIDTQLPGCI